MFNLFVYAKQAGFKFIAHSLRLNVLYIKMHMQTPAHQNTAANLHPSHKRKPQPPTYRQAQTQAWDNKKVFWGVDSRDRSQVMKKFVP